MITIFTTTKNFTDEFLIIQKNALLSWRSLSSEIQILIIGNSYGSKEIAEEINAEYFPSVKCSNNGAPIISDLFKIARKNARFDVLMYVNADIILPLNLIPVINKVSKIFKKFLLVGQRWDLDLKKNINFKNVDKLNHFWETISINSKQAGPSAIDYFIFKKTQFFDVPNLIIGRWGWDNWFLWKARRNRYPLIDATNEIKVIHQNHSYSFHNIKSLKHSKTGKEALLNKKIIKGNTLNLLDCNYEINAGNIVKRQNLEFIVRNLYRLPRIFSEISWILTLYRRFYIYFLIKKQK